jgi:anhydro-N-acetylmuramic acid kinase
LSGDVKNVIGLMSGTSMDAIDVAWLRTDGEEIIEPGPASEFGYQPAERDAVRAALGSEEPSEAAVAAVTDAHVRAVAAFLQLHPQLEDNLDLIGFHGQTIFHDPANRKTVQIGDAQAIARHFGVPVVHDFRSDDVAAGGQGAPFAPLFHQAMSGGIERPFCVLNLGGVGNVTWIGNDDQILAFDTGPANALLDDLVLKHTGVAFDRDGSTARSGSADWARVKEFLSQSYFERMPPKSLDRNEFDSSISEISVPDAAATLLEFTVGSVAAARAHMPLPPVGWIVTGGGRKNAFLMERLEAELSTPVEPVEAAGWNGDALEAQCFAWLAVRSQRGLPLSVPQTTGVPVPLAGGRTACPPTASLSGTRGSA